MIVYHIDRSGSLHEGMTFALSPSGLSRHGEHYWGSVPAKEPDLANDFIIEHIFEEVRLADYPDKPSRFTSAFACLSLDHVTIWQYRHPNLRSGTVWQVQSPTLFLADAALLRCMLNTPEQQVFDFSFARACAHEYWQGATAQSLSPGFPYKDWFRTCIPEPEVLLPPTATVIGRL